jgi:hypothetical protein
MQYSSLLSVRAVAKHFGVTATWLKAEADAGRVPCLRAGKRYLFNTPAVEAVLFERAAAAAKEVANG